MNQTLFHRITAFSAALLALMLVACSAGSTPTPTPLILVMTATPPAVPTQPDLTETALPPEPTDSAPQDEASAEDDPATPVDQPTPSATASTSSGGGSGASNAASTPRPPNRLNNPGFEGSTNRIDFDAVNVVNGWRPFYCAPPYTPGICKATRAGSGNEGGLEYTIPEYARTTTGHRIHGGNQAQQWWCEFRACRGGVYQTFDTTPGELCEIGAWVQTWSAAEDGSNRKSDLQTRDERDNSTWYVRVDPTGGTYAWGEDVRVSPGFGFSHGVYDKFVRISHTFRATSDRMTVYFENVRLWPVKNNYSFLDDAFAYCSPPAEEADLRTPSEAGLRIGPFTDVHGSIQPVFGTPESNAWDGGSINTPDVVRVGDQFWMYYTSRNRVGLATSPDGINWTRYGSGPVFTTSDDIAQPSIVYEPDTGQWHMWYIVVEEDDDNYSRVFRYAVSNDGLNWQARGGDGVLTTGTPGAWNEERIDGLDVMKVGDTFILCNAGTALEPEFVRSIGCFTSANGIDWTPYLDNPVLSPHPAFADWEGNEVELPSLDTHDGLWLMGHTGFGGPQGNRFRIGIAASRDGITWEHLFRNPAIPWVGDDDSTDNPSISIDAEKGLVWLWYVYKNDDYPDGAIYAATAPITFPD